MSYQTRIWTGMCHSPLYPTVHCYPTLPQDKHWDHPARSHTTEQPAPETGGDIELTISHHYIRTQRICIVWKETLTVKPCQFTKIVKREFCQAGHQKWRHENINWTECTWVLPGIRTLCYYWSRLNNNHVNRGGGGLTQDIYLHLATLVSTWIAPNLYKKSETPWRPGEENAI